MMLPQAELVHQTKGRLRVRIPGQRGNREYFGKIRESLAELEGAQSVETNYLTGSVLVLHESSPKVIQDYAEEKGLFQVRHNNSQAIALSRRIASGFKQVEGRVNALTKGEVDVTGLAFLGLAVAGAFQIFKKNVWPAGVTLLWYAASVVLGAGTEAATRPADPSLSDQPGPGRTYVQ
jgi:hypothetical protein